MTFKVDGIQPKERPRFRRMGNRIISYTPKKTHDYEKRIAESYVDSGLTLLTEDKTPLKIDVRVYQSIPKSTPKKYRAAMLDGRVRPCGRPDADNYLKIAMDGLNGIAYRDDGCVVDATVSKWYTDGEPYMLIDVSKLEVGDE